MTNESKDKKQNDRIQSFKSRINFLGPLCLLFVLPFMWLTYNSIRFWLLKEKDLSQSNMIILYVLSGFYGFIIIFSIVCFLVSYFIDLKKNRAIPKRVKENDQEENDYTKFIFNFLKSNQLQYNDLIVEKCKKVMRYAVSWSFFVSIIFWTIFWTGVVPYLLALIINASSNNISKIIYNFVSFGSFVTTLVHALLKILTRKTPKFLILILWKRLLMMPFDAETANLYIKSFTGYNKKISRAIRKASTWENRFRDSLQKYQEENKDSVWYQFCSFKFDTSCGNFIKINTDMFVYRIYINSYNKWLLNEENDITYRWMHWSNYENEEVQKYSNMTNDEYLKVKPMSNYLLEYDRKISNREISLDIMSMLKLFDDFFQMASKKTENINDYFNNSK